MTNKMPVVGKIYKTKKGKVHLGHKDSEVLGVNKDLVWHFQDPAIFSYEKREYHHYEIVTIDRFWTTHEELPEDNEVERALEELKLKLKNNFWCESQYHYELLDSITNLINALEAEKNMSKEEPKIDIKEKRVDPEIEIGSEWQSIDGKVVKIDFIKNNLVVWTYEFNDREQITFSTKKEFFIKDFKELKRK
jgi:hypothetical protein